MVKKLKITTLFEDSAPKYPFRGAHGLSFWIEADNKTILFDAGGAGEILLHNLQILNLKLKDLDAFVLSHSHADHSAGISAIAEQIKNIPMYCPSDAFSSRYLPDRQKISRLISKKIYPQQSLEIFPGIFTPAERKTINSPFPTKEINLVINLEKKGLVIIVGCSHHGLLNIINDAQSLFANKIPLYALLGGFHLKDTDEKEIIKIIDFFKKSGLKFLAPNHCTGFKALKIMTEEFSESMSLIKGTATGNFHTGITIEF